MSSIPRLGLVHSRYSTNILNFPNSLCRGGIAEDKRGSPRLMAERAGAPGSELHRPCTGTRVTSRTWKPSSVSKMARSTLGLWNWARVVHTNYPRYGGSLGKERLCRVPRRFSLSTPRGVQVRWTLASVRFWHKVVLSAHTAESWARRYTSLSCGFTRDTLSEPTTSISHVLRVFWWQGESHGKEGGELTLRYSPDPHAG